MDMNLNEVLGYAIKVLSQSNIADFRHYNRPSLIATWLSLMLFVLVIDQVSLNPDPKIPLS
jgi:hypothetical protein